MSSMDNYHIPLDEESQELCTIGCAHPVEREILVLKLATSSTYGTTYVEWYTGTFFYEHVVGPVCQASSDANVTRFLEFGANYLTSKDRYVNSITTVPEERTWSDRMRNAASKAASLIGRS